MWLRFVLKFLAATLLVGLGWFAFMIGMRGAGAIEMPAALDLPMAGLVGSTVGLAYATLDWFFTALPSSRTRRSREDDESDADPAATPDRHNPNNMGDPESD